ncbi:amino acid transporter heavy chain SLC3A1-like [Tachypleus tridentatus]|uniref:amino acid transporter heavy chain SLC3A1-like n=1 Tax=Tachypleus tridentatus TaxID=6853 RepID=UPI003FD5BBB2
MDNSIRQNGEIMLTVSDGSRSRLKERGKSNISLISRCSSTDSEQGQEIGCSTYLLDPDNSKPFIIHLSQEEIQSTTADTDSNVSFRTREHSLSKCPLDILFYHWNWAGFRLGCFVVFVCVLVGIFCFVLKWVTSQTSHCVPPREWWQGTVSYEIFPASFQDSDDDGFGDFTGLRQRLHYVQKLNVASIRLNSIFSALDYPLEYTHVIDFKNVDPHLGRTSDFDELVQDIHARGLYVILDINPALTSDQHPWAAHWQQNKSGEYKYFYVESNDTKGENIGPQEEKKNPNRPFGGHLFLNWSHPAVQMELNSALEFWLQKGVDGFYMKGLEHLQFALEIDLYSVMKQWRQLLDKYSTPKKKNILLVSSQFIQAVKEKTFRYMVSLLKLCDILDFRLHFNGTNIQDFREQLTVADEWNFYSSLSWVNWHIGGSETTRLATRIDTTYTLSTVILLLMLPGSVSLFYGDEINLQDSKDALTGKIFREGQLCPMQWTSAKEANFTKNWVSPWLPIHSMSSNQNVEDCSAEISLISQLIATRDKSASLWMKAIYDGKSAVCDGRPFTYVVHSGNGRLITLERNFPTKERYVVSANFGPKSVTVDFSKLFSEAHILFSTESELQSEERSSRPWNSQNVSLDPGDAIIIEPR